MELASRVDAAVGAPVLVVGSLPPSGHDLDLLARPVEYAAIEACLGLQGFLSSRHSWLRLDESGVSKVDLAGTGNWGWDARAASVLFRGAEPVPGFRHLVRPSPATVLLLAARSLMAHRGGLTAKGRGRVARALERDPQAWPAAEDAAAEVGLLPALRLLRKTYASGQSLPARVRAGSVTAVWFRGQGLRANARLFADDRTRRWRPAIVSFSGVDGSGKSTQAAGLRDTLRELGIRADVQWAGVKTGSRLRALLPLLDGPSGSVSAAPSTDPPDPLIPGVLRNSSLGRHLWLGHVVAVNVASLWGHVAHGRQTARVLIFDRFTPDTAMKLEMRYAVQRRFDIRWQAALFALLSPKPDVGFIVDVPVQLAHRRRQQENTLAELSLMSRLYERQVRRFGLIRLDGTQSSDTLHQRVVTEVWRGLG